MPYEGCRLYYHGPIEPDRHPPRYQSVSGIETLRDLLSTTKRAGACLPSLRVISRWSCVEEFRSARLTKVVQSMDGVRQRKPGAMIRVPCGIFQAGREE